MERANSTVNPGPQNLESRNNPGLSETSKVISKTKLVNHNNNVMALKESGNRLAIPQKVRDSARIKLKLMQQQQTGSGSNPTTAKFRFKQEDNNSRQLLLQQQQQHNPETVVVQTTTQGKIFLTSNISQIFHQLFSVMTVVEFHGEAGEIQ